MPLKKPQGINITPFPIQHGWGRVKSTLSAEGIDIGLGGSSGGGGDTHIQNNLNKSLTFMLHPKA